jgi:hypothetical protein
VSYLPRFQKQLTPISTAGEDCVVRVSLMGIDYSTRGQVKPTVKDFRKRAGKTTGGLNTAQMEAGVESFNTPAETMGYTNLRCTRHSDGKWNDIIEALRANQWVACWINYAWINKNYPQYSGDPGYMGTHCVGALCIRQVTGKDGKRSQQVRVWDPTYDGRRNGIPRGPLWWPLHVLRRACAAAKDVNEFRGGIIPLARPMAWG